MYVFVFVGTLIQFEIVKNEWVSRLCLGRLMLIC
jgi:hypothetical protein